MLLMGCGLAGGVSEGGTLEGKAQLRLLVSARAYSIAWGVMEVPKLSKREVTGNSNGTDRHFFFFF